MSKRDLTKLVQDAGTDVQPLRRGRGLDALMPESYTGKPTSNDTGIHTSQNADMSTSIHAATVERKTKTYRIRDDLAHQIDVFAITNRRKIYEVVEAAFEDYLARQAPPE